LTYYKYLLLSLVLLVLSIYLFATRPPPLAQSQPGRVSVQVGLDLVAAENDKIRALYTKEIVGAGLKAGLRFSKDWQQAGVDAGPLPALFLREMARHLEASPVPLNLFLGSDQPIAAANRFVGDQAERFKTIRETRKRIHFFAKDTNLYTAMYPDIAAVDACVNCHNNEASSPKRDWQIDDVMGATSFSYPQKELSINEVLLLIFFVRQAAVRTYASYLEKTGQFVARPTIGLLWPRDSQSDVGPESHSPQFYLPSEEVFSQRLNQEVSAATMTAILEASRTATNVPR